MNENHVRDVADFEAMIGRRIVKIERIMYVYKGEIDTSNGDGDVQITIDDGTSLLLRPGADGYFLHIEHEQWIDPFREPLSDENREFVESSGKWSIFDVSSCDVFRVLIGSAIDKVNTLMDNNEVIVGLEIVSGGHILRYMVQFDEGNLYCS